jgi:DNA-binding response OmpR family regulator
MVYPPYAAPFPDRRTAEITLGGQQRAVLSTMAQRPGRVFTADELAAQLKLPALTPRRADALISGINRVLGEDAIATVPRRGWMLRPYEEDPVTIRF